MYRCLSDKEIEILELRGCSADTWNTVEVKDTFLPERLRNVRFSGKIRLGENNGKTDFNGTLFKPSGIFNCDIRNCIVGDNVYLSNIGTLANYTIDDDVFIENVGVLVVSGMSTFGNGHEIEILNEGGGRELPVFDRLSAQVAYLLVMYRHNRKFSDTLKSIIDRYVRTRASEIGTIGKGSKIRDVKTIHNVRIGVFAHIRGASLLEDGTVGSNQLAPVFIGEDVSASRFIVLSGSVIKDGAIISSTFVGQGVQIGRQFSAENSAFFANCEAFHSEACSIFAGPYTVTHHRSTLLIAGLFSFYNAGSGTNQSNHMYKLGPVHQGIVERGAKTGSFSYMLWPCRVGPFSVVMDKHAGNFDTTDLPFSYISVEDGKSVLTPAMNLFTVGTARDSRKWPARDRREDTEKLDLIHFDILSPFTAQKILNGIKLLERLHADTPKSREFVSYKGVFINRLMLRTSKRYYELALMVYLTGQLVKRLETAEFKSLDEIEKILQPRFTPEQKKWVDLAGMFAEKKSVEYLMDSVVSGEITTLDILVPRLQAIYEEYGEKSWSWCLATLKEWKDFDLESLSIPLLLEVLEEWKNNSLKLNNMILKDAEKEFDQLSRIGFGNDGDGKEQLDDFENIRGKYESNSFVLGLKKESEKTESLYSQLSGRLKELTGLQDGTFMD